MTVARPGKALRSFAGVLGTRSRVLWVGVVVALVAVTFASVTVGGRSPANAQVAPPNDRFEPNDTFGFAAEIDPPWSSQAGAYELGLPVGDRDLFSFSAEKGDVLTAEIAFEPGAWTEGIRVVLGRPDMAAGIVSPLAVAEAPKGPVTLTCLAPTIGEYLLEVSRVAAGPRATVRYRLSVGIERVSPPPPGVFVDVRHWMPYSFAIDRLAAAGMVEGYDAFGLHLFGPTDPVTRGQFAKMAAAALRLPVSEGDRCPFPDVALAPDGLLYPDHVVGAAAKAGLMVGREGLFSPGEQLSRAQLVTIVVRAARMAGPVADPPRDYRGTVAPFSPAHDDALRTAEYGNLLVGLQAFSTTWDPWRPATRGEAAQLLFNVVGATLEPKGQGREAPARAR